MVTGMPVSSVRLPDDAMSWIEDVRGSPVRAFDALPGGAGRRAYWRCWLADDSSAILMHACPEDPAVLPPALRSPRVAIPFVSVTELLARHGLPVPELFGVREKQLWVLLEDLGERHLLDLSGRERRARHREAIELLARAHAIADEPDALPFQRRFDREWIEFELSLFARDLCPSELREELAVQLAELARAIEALPTTLCLRDYQSHNLMIDPNGALRIIDYQDALLAPPQLDLAALLFDSYLTLEADERDELLALYTRRQGAPVDRESLALLTVQRKCKDLSRFHQLVNVRGDPRYRGALEAARSAIAVALPALPSGHAALAELIPRVLERGAA